MHLLRLEKETTWPEEALVFLENNQDVFRNWKTRKKPVDPLNYDEAVAGLLYILRHTNYCLRGYHCTRLTDEEIQAIRDGGMRLLNGLMLQERIRNLEQQGLIDKRIADYLLSNHQANDQNRAGKIWFCFYPPRMAGQRSIERLFRSWGGEALYNSHERDDFTGPILTTIGRPCLVEAYVPIASLSPHGGIDDNIVARYLKKRGLRSDMDLRFEAYAQQPIPATHIVRLVKFPQPAFLKLTGCTTWKPSLDKIS